MPPPGKLMRYPVTEIPTEKLATIEASIVSSTPGPKTDFGEFSQEVEDLVDQANGDIFPSMAVNRLERAIKKNMPGIHTPSVYITLGTRYEDLNNTEKAIENYSKALDLDGDNAFPLLFRGELYFQQGKYDLAKQDIRKAIGLGGLDEYTKNEGLSYLLQIESKEK